VASWSTLWIIHETRPLAVSLTRENGPFELLTFAVALIGGIDGLNLSIRMKMLSTFQRQCVGVLAIAMILFAMEEVAWGQQLIGFDPPDFIRSINSQGELTIYNLKYFQGTSEVPEFLISLSVLVCLVKIPERHPLSVPGVMFPIVGLTLFLSAGDLVQDLMNRMVAGHVLGRVGVYFNQIDELSELLIAFSGFLYIRLIGRRTRQNAPRRLTPNPLCRN